MRLTAFLVSVAAVTAAQGPAPAADLPSARVDPILFSNLQYRPLHFPRGGRSTAVAGVPSDPLTFYFGSIGGGVWKTTDAGTTWTNVSDGFFAAGSVGAIAVAESAPEVVYVGTGTACLRTNVSPGVGMYRSSDAGRTWVHAGLRDAGQIGRVRIHPANPDLVYAAVLGNVFAPAHTRGVFRSHDGGKTWQKVLFVNAFTTHFTNFHTPENVRFGQDYSPGASQLLNYLVSQAFVPEFQVRWRWKPNSVAFWDNRSTQHYAVMDYPPCHRKMERAGIIGDLPY